MCRDSSRQFGLRRVRRRSARGVGRWDVAIISCLLARERVERRRLRHLRCDRRDKGEKNADADENVHSGEELAGVRLGREVAVADGGQRDDAEVQRVDEAKPFDQRVEAGATGDGDPGKEAERDERDSRQTHPPHDEPEPP